MTTTAKPKARPPGDAAWRAIVGMHDRVSAIEHALAPALVTPKENTVTEPRSTQASNGTTNWSVYPDHDPEYLAGQITLEQARMRHIRPDEGCGCPNCVHRRKQAARIVSPEPEPQARCPFCRGSGYTGRPEGMGWQPCAACNAAEFERLAREAYQGNQFSAASDALLTARQRIIDCTECHGSGKTWQPLPTPCSPCRGTGKDDHLVTPRGTLWRKASGDYAKDTSGTSGGGSPPEQRTMWSARWTAPCPPPPCPTAPSRPSPQASTRARPAPGPTSPEPEPMLPRSPDPEGADMYDTDVEDEVARLALQYPGKIALTPPATRAFYPPVDTEPEVTLADLSEDDLDGAMAEVAEWRGISLTDVAGQVDVLAGGERDTYSRAVALAELAGMDPDDALSLTVSTEKRDELADKGRGWALPDGSFPVHDAKHVGVAKAFFKQGKLAGHPASVVKAHINRAAARLGLPGLDTDEDDDTEDATDREAERRPRKPRGEPAHPARSGHATRPVQVKRRGQVLAAEGGGPEGGEGPSGAGGAAMSARRVAVRTTTGYQTLALSADQADELGLAAEPLSPVDRIVRRNPELFLASRSFYNEVPSAFEDDPEVLLKKPGFDIHEITGEDPTDPDGGDVDKIIARLQRDHNQYFSPSKTYGSVTTHRR